MVVRGTLKMSWLPCIRPFLAELKEGHVIPQFRVCVPYNEYCETVLGRYGCMRMCAMITM